MNLPALPSTRGKIVRWLRRKPHSVTELAAALNLTDNAVRAHLLRLERDGLVRQAGSRAGFRKPEAVFEITTEAERLFASAYAPVLGSLLATLEARLKDSDLDAHLREVGRRLAAPHLPSMAGLPARDRATKTLQILENLGGLADVEERDGRTYVRGFGCLMSEVVPVHPKLCRMAQALVAELLGHAVQEQCERGDRPKCCFVIEA